MELGVLGYRIQPLPHPRDTEGTGQSALPAYGAPGRGAGEGRAEHRQCSGLSPAIFAAFTHRWRDRAEAAPSLYLSIYLPSQALRLTSRPLRPAAPPSQGLCKLQGALRNSIEAGLLIKMHFLAVLSRCLSLTAAVCRTVPEIKIQCFPHLGEKCLAF